MKKYLSKISTDFDTTKNSIQKLRKEQEKLSRQGLEYGSVSFKDQRYMRVIRPASENGQREFIYIGTDPVKQQRVLDAIQRAKRFQELESIKRELEATLSHYEREVGYLQSSLSRRLKTIPQAS